MPTHNDPILASSTSQNGSQALPRAAAPLPRIQRFFTGPGPFTKDEFKWDTRVAEIKGAGGKSVFRAEGIEVPATWSQTATDIVAEKYLRAVRQPDGTLKRETSAWEMATRVAGTIARWGRMLGYFATAEDAAVFTDELVWIVLNQSAAFNSPVWFNVGTSGEAIHAEQASACFILSVEDRMDSILELSRTEGVLYKGGSGSGVNYSDLRSSQEKLSGGGTASGPVPFIAKDDANGGAIKSGGGTRRAAKMAILNADHGDIIEFIDCKAKAEKMAHALVDAGFDSDFRTRFGAYQSVPFQNANHSVRVTNEFMQAVVADGDWNLLTRPRDGKSDVLSTVKARMLWEKICDAAWLCGDPGLQFDTTINEMHTIPGHGRINGSNPCSEYMSIDDSACNLASLNLKKFQRADGELDVPAFRHTIDVMITAMDIIVDGASYPIEKVGVNARRHRQLGLGYANLGAYLMSRGFAYDSDEGRKEAALITALMCGRAYRRSAELAAHVGPFEGFDMNRASMLSVIQKHRNALDRYTGTLETAAELDWNDALSFGKQHGFRNSQATVLAPTGTIAFMMDCDTTGIEPDLALTKTKKLVGGGTLKIVNQGVAQALRSLGYNENLSQSISKYAAEHGSVVSSMVLMEHVAVFDTALAEPIGKRSIPADAHVLMMGAVQPFISGAISKTANMPENATPKDVSEIYMLAWKEGVKAIAIYRDGCKRTQPMQAGTKETVQVPYTPTPARRNLPDTRNSKTHKFYVGEHKGYMHVGMFDDGTPGELFIRMNKEGSTIAGLMDTIGILTSVALQYGVPLDALVEKFSHVSFEPSGWTNSPLGRATSIVDYVFRWMGTQWGELGGTQAAQVQRQVERIEQEVTPATTGHVTVLRSTVSGTICTRCGHTMVRTGACHTCPTCGLNSGCG